jgi:DNA/RNA endonuclease G, NUC1
MSIRHCLLAAFLMPALAVAMPAAQVIHPRACAGNGQLHSGLWPAPVGPQAAQDGPLWKICFSAYDTLYSGARREPLASTEYLTAARLRAHRGLRRSDDFRPLQQIPAADANPLSAYVRNHYDRGHMAPAGDMPDAVAMRQSFYMTNMTAQWDRNNRHLWEGVEATTRWLVLHGRPLYVVSGPIFSGTARLRGGPVIPAGFFKAVYDPAGNRAGAWVVTNTASDHYAVVPLAWVDAHAGIRPFPGLSSTVAAWDLPTPYPDGHALPASDRVPVSSLRLGATR